MQLVRQVVILLVSLIQEQRNNQGNTVTHSHKFPLSLETFCQTGRCRQIPFCISNVFQVKLNLSQCWQRWFLVAMHRVHIYGLCCWGLLRSRYVFMCCLPAWLTIVERLFAPTPSTLSCLHRVTSVSMGVFDSLRVAMDTCTLGLYHVWLQITEGTFPKLI